MIYDHMWYVCYEDEGNGMTWKNFYYEKEARERYETYKGRKARVLCKNDKVVEKDGLYFEMKKYAEENYTLEGLASLATVEAALLQGMKLDENERQ